jgi:hypothetical protein
MPSQSVFTAAARRVWLLACAGAMINAIHTLSGASFGLPQVVWATWIYVAVLGCCGLAALVAGGSAGGARVPCLLLGVGMLAYAPGQALYTQIVAHQSSATFPTLADYGWLAFYPCALGAVILTVRGSVASVRCVALLDGLIGALTMLAVGSVLVVDLALFGHGLQGGQVGNIVYSFADQVLAGIALGTFACSDGGHRGCSPCSRLASCSWRSRTRTTCTKSREDISRPADGGWFSGRPPL